jgi:tyrosine-protein phosphatase SIW14
MRLHSLLLAGVLTVAPVAAQTSAPVAPAAESAQKAVRITIDNFGQINPNYYRGAQPEAADIKALSSLGVKMVIDLTKGGRAEEAAQVTAAGMKFMRIPMTTSDTPDKAAVAQFLELVNNPENQPVYVHCQGGKHRTGVMTAAYRMTHDDWTADQAYAEMKKFRFETFLGHPELKAFVYDYFQQLEGGRN